MIKNKTFRRFLIIAFALIGLAGGILVGPASINVAEVFKSFDNPILKLRIMRVILAFAAGAGLSVSGVILQAILKNPLAEPYILGVSSGSALGSIIAILAGLGALFQPVTGFALALLTISAVIWISRSNGATTNQSLILVGVAVSTVLASVCTYLISVSDSEYLRGVLWWLLGSIQIFDLTLLKALISIVTICCALSWFFWRDLNAISLGDEEAAHLGIRVNTVKTILICLCSATTAAIVSACGIIGFVGLIVPHSVRLLLGQEHRRLMPWSFLAGGSFLVLCDAIARRVAYPAELPIGVVTAIIGGPVFILLLKKQSRTQN
jgi:iron complex transport system permease protein